MNGFDFARFSAKQVRAHCESNHRQVALDRSGFQAQHQQALARCSRLELEADAEQRAFLTWRTQFVGARRDAWGHFGAAADQAVARAQYELSRLQATWAALQPLLSEDERARWIAAGTASSSE